MDSSCWASCRQKRDVLVMTVKLAMPAALRVGCAASYQFWIVFKLGSSDHCYKDAVQVAARGLQGSGSGSRRRR